MPHTDEMRWAVHNNDQHKIVELRFQLEKTRDKAARSHTTMPCVLQRIAELSVGKQRVAASPS